MDRMVVANVIRKTNDIVGNLVVEECTRLYWLREDIKWIPREIEWTRKFLEDADTKHFNSQEMATLVREIGDLAHDLEDVVDIYLPVVQTHKRKSFVRYLQCLLCILCNGYTNHKFSMEIASIKKRVEDINRKRTTYGITDNINITERIEEPRRSSQHFPHVDEEIIVAVEPHIDKLRAKLLDPEKHSCTISIVAMPGVGKTTLAKQVYNSIRVNFECCAWVCVSKNPRVKDLQKDISRQVGMEKEKWENNAGVEALYEFLKQKRYLIVLDDIWETETWDALKNGIPNHGIQGSRLIITSRNKEVGRYASSDTNLHELLPLNDEQSWELLSKIVKLDETNSSPELIEVGQKISQRCSGLPLAITAMAGVLKKKEKDAWRGVLHKMGQQPGQISEILDLSYRDLPFDLKPCFLYFGLFPEDHEIPAIELTSIWVAEGYITDREGQTLEDTGEDFLNELINRNLIQIATRKFDGRIKSCRIHDVLHSFCISIAQKNNFYKTYHDDYAVIDTRVHRIAIHYDVSDDISKKHHSPKLRAMLVFNKEQEGSELLEHVDEYRFIRVLCIEGLVFPSSFPRTIGNLILLKYLRLKGSSLRSFPSAIGTLSNLQTLDVQECENVILPAVIWKMEELRCILLAPTTRFRKVITDVCLPNLQSLYTLNGDFLEAKSLLKLGSLRTLGLCCCMKKFGRMLKDGKPISKKLEKLQLEIWDDGPYDIRRSQEIHELDPSTISDNSGLPTPPGPPLNFSGYQKLRYLYLEGPLTSLPEFPPSLVKLTLVRSALKQDPMVRLGKLPNLKKLQLRRSTYMGCEMVISGVGSFPQLEVLITEPMPSLKLLKVREGVMPRLRCARINCIITLDIESDRLKNIFNEFNNYLMGMSFLELQDITINWGEEDFFFWEDDDSILPPPEIADKGKKLISEGMADQEIVEVQRGISGNPLEIGQSSLSETPQDGSE